MLRRALLVSVLLTVTVLAGCASEEAPAGEPAPQELAAPNVGGSDKVVTSVFPGD